MRRAALMLALTVASLGCDEGDVARAGALPDAAPALVDAALDADPFLPAHDATVTDWGPPPDAPPPPQVAAAWSGFAGDVALYARNQVTGEALAHDADRRLYGGTLERLLAAVAWSSAVADGRLAPDATFPLRADLRRGSPGLASTPTDTVSLADLARATVVDGDLTAEEALVEALGGESAVSDTVASLGIAGLGAYLGPCSRARAVAEALVGGAIDADCAALSAWVDGGDPSGLGFAPPPIDADRRREAVDAVTATGLATLTAAALGELLARLDALTLLGPRTDAPLRALLDDSLGAGGGADDLPRAAWAGSLCGATPSGRHWVGLLRGAGDPAVLVVLTVGTEGSEAEEGQILRDAGREAWRVLVGALDPQPPAFVEAPPWLSDAVLLDAGDAAPCDALDADFSAARDCRRQHARATFSTGDRPGVSVLMDDPPPVAVAWIWEDPSGRRYRYQVRFAAHHRWVWTRSLRIRTPGDWRVDLMFDGVPGAAFTFPVR